MVNNFVLSPSSANGFTLKQKTLREKVLRSGFGVTLDRQKITFT